MKSEVWFTHASMPEIQEINVESAEYNAQYTVNFQKAFITIIITFLLIFWKWNPNHGAKIKKEEHA